MALNSGSSIILGVWNNFQLQTITIDNINIDENVQSFRSEALKKLDPSLQNIEFTYCGIVLQDEKPLSAYGVTPGALIHAIDKKSCKTVNNDKKLSEGEVQKLLVNFGAFTMGSGYRAVLQRLSRKEVLEKITAAVPGLENDLTAMAILQDPELMAHFSDADTVRKISERHPLLLQAANYIISHIQEIQPTANPNQASTSSGYSYSLEALSDDDDMDSSSDTNMGNPLQRNSSYNAITAAQLAAAIASATNTAFNMGSAGMPTTPTSSGTNVITNEMFTSAMQQVFAQASNNGQNSAGEESMESILRRLQPQLQQMHEMGLNNDGVNVRALQATNGDVQAAIELVFNGVID